MKSKRRSTKQKCEFCGLSHFSLRMFEGHWICAACDYLELVRAESFDLAEAISYLRRKELCAYCGEPATDVEHVVPRVSKLPTFTVPACRECNGIAGGRLFSCFEEKHDFIRRRLERRNKKLLSMPEWDEDEISELGRGLRDYVGIAQRQRARMVQRLEWNWLDAVLGKGE